MSDAEAGMENVLKANPKGIVEQCEKQFSELKEAYREAMLELKFRKSCNAIATQPRSCGSSRDRDG